jgi:type IV pilus assembly protein PilB
MSREDSRRQLGDLLVTQGVIKEAELTDALKIQKETGEALGKVLVKLGLVTEADLLRILANQLGLDFVDLADYKVDLGAVALVPERIAKKNTILPIGFEDNKLIVAVANPTDVFIFDDLRMMTGFEVKPVVATKDEIIEAIARYAHADKIGEQAMDDLTREALGIQEDEQVSVKVQDEAPIVKLANLIINQAITDRASDIHIEPQEKDVRVRYRIDGVLHEVMTPPKRVQAGLISRIKIMSDLNIAETRVPQDGRIGLQVQGRGVDLRVATLPTVYGEKIVMRILEKESIMIDLKDMGFLPDSLDRFQSTFKKPYGAILITGPTGSGKTTSLYAALNVLNSVEKKIITVEDPVEYKLPGVIQVQINARVGLTFAAALRSILRNDPDLVMIGEIRDRETALIAVESALTGHLVLATLHTNDAPQALTRLTEMGIEPFLSASAVDCVVAQRLARKLCAVCKEEYSPDEEALTAANFPFEKGNAPKLFKPVGCPKCKGSGYKGRTGIYEVMLVSETIEKLAVERASSDEIARQAKLEGMHSLRDDGLEKVRLGITSLEEVLRVVA